MATNIRFDPIAVSKLLVGKDGPAMRLCIVFSEQVKRETIGAMRSEFPKEFLGQSLVKRVGVDGTGGFVDVGSEKTKTRPHPIEGNPLLVFFWPKVGRVVFLPRVNHPGSDFGPYLKKKLKEGFSKARGMLSSLRVER